eukprot:112200-Prymnesium_polylepis.1
MAPAGSARIVEHREKAQGARSPVDLRRRSRRTQGYLEVGGHVPLILAGAPLSLTCSSIAKPAWM